MPKKCFESKGELPWSCEGSQARCLLTVIPGFIGYRILQGLLSVLGCCGSCPGIGQVVQVLMGRFGSPRFGKFATTHLQILQVPTLKQARTDHGQP